MKIRYSDSLYYLAKQKFMEDGDFWHVKVMRLCLFEPLRAARRIK